MTDAINGRQRADRIARAFAIVAIVVAILVLISPLQFSANRAGAVGSTAHSSAVAGGEPVSGGHARTQRFFGFAESDWDPDAPPGMAPDFDPWPELTPRNGDMSAGE